jgi:hypothetical protein
LEPAEKNSLLISNPEKKQDLMRLLGDTDLRVISLIKFSCFLDLRNTWALKQQQQHRTIDNPVGLPYGWNTVMRRQTDMNVPNPKTKQIPTQSKSKSKKARGPKLLT